MSRAPKRVDCQYLHFAKTEDIRLKSASEGKKSLLLITAYDKEALIWFDCLSVAKC
jgi:hypothetical protein